MKKLSFHMMKLFGKNIRDAAGVIKMCRILNVVFFFFIITLSATTLASSLADWKKVRGRDLPAVVEAVVFRNQVLDTNHHFRYGNWTVKMGFQGKSPYADSGVGSDGLKEWLNIYIRNLTCSNPVRGDLQCHLTLSRPPGSGCFLLIKDMWKLDYCPTGLRLK